MTRLELERKLLKAGWKLVQGACHELAVSPDGKKKISIPRHKGDIPKGTALAILKEAGLS